MILLGALRNTVSVINDEDKKVGNHRYVCKTLQDGNRNMFRPL